jgi:hypothetical protein
MLEETTSLSGDQVKQRGILKTEFQQLLDDEELYWFKRSHETWLLKGDNNTNYFHRIANGRKRKQAIYFMNDGDK